MSAIAIGVPVSVRSAILPIPAIQPSLRYSRDIVA